MVWIRFPILNLMYYDKEIIKKVDAGVVILIKVDMTTQMVERGKYAHVCAEIDLQKLWLWRYGLMITGIRCSTEFALNPCFLWPLWTCGSKV